MNEKNRDMQAGERVRYLEQVIRQTQEALELAANLGDFQASVNTFETPETILATAEERVRRVMAFEATAWLLISEEDASFGMARCEPPDAEARMRAELDRLAENKTMAWALDSPGAVTVATEDGAGHLVIHTLATASRIRGLFMGRLACDPGEIPDSFKTLLTIILQGCANTIESYELYRLNRRTTRRLEEKVAELLQAESRLRAKGRELEDTVSRLRLENTLHLKAREELHQAGQEARAAAEALRESEERYRTLFETMVQGVVILDRDGTILSINPAGAKILGVSSEAMGTMRCDDPAWENLREDGSPFPPEELPSVVALSAGKAVHGVVVGKINLMEGKRHWLTVNAVPLFQEGRDSPSQVFCTMSDITELRRSERVLKRLVDSMPVLIHAHDSEGRYVFWNKECERVLGYMADEVYNDPRIREAMYPDPDFRRKVVEHYHKDIIDFEDWEAPMRASDGTTRIIAWTSRSSQAPIQGWSSWETGVDITARKLAEEALERLTAEQEELIRERTLELTRKTSELVAANRKLKRLDELKSAFLTAVSHDIRTPLTSIMGFAKLAMRDFERHYRPLAGDDEGLAAKGERLRDNLAVIVSEGERLTRLINDFLDLSRIEAGRLHWKDRDMDPAQALATAVRAVSGDYEAKPRVTLEIESEGDLPRLHADPDRIVQVLVNLLHNAVKFTDQGRVRATVEARGRMVRYTVSDTGMGIPAEELETVFDKFHQLVGGDRVSDKARGSGLGLSICRQIVAHYQGEIWVESSYGHGSTFYVELPGRS